MSGYVRYPSGEAVSNVTTALMNGSGSVFASGRRSDSSGYYWDYVPAGTFTLAARGLSGFGTSYSEPNIVVNGDTTKNITLIAVSVSPDSAVLSVGQSQLFTAVSDGGSGTYTTYKWYVNGALVSGETGSTYRFSSKSEGSYSIYATTIDSEGAISSKSTTAVATVSGFSPSPTPTPTPSPLSPSSESTPTPTSSPEPQPEQEPFPTLLIATASASFAVVGIGGMVYFKKRKH